MSLGTTSFLALVVGEKTRAPAFVATFQDLISDRAPNEGTLKIELFESLQSFLKTQRNRNDLNGIVVDQKLISEASQVERKALELLEGLSFPILRIGQEMIQGGAVESKILKGKWSQMLEQIRAFAPRGLRSNPRKICFVKIRYSGPDGQPEEQRRAVTYDLSRGGCFVVSMEDWGATEEIELYIGNMSKPVPCRIAWKLPWGQSHWRMPGIGVEFLEISDELKREIGQYFEANDE
jgi:hypothetical protein